MISTGKLTTEDYWSGNYENRLNRVVTLEYKKNLSLSEVHVFLKSVLPTDNEKKFLEVGCAPGVWMHYFHSVFGYEVEGIEYTGNGVRMTRNNLKKLGIPARIYHQDFLRNSLEKESYDVVFSGGFIEHFDNPDDVVQKHIELLKKGGFLILEIPNLKGVNHFFQKRIDPDIIKIHNLEIMDLRYFDDLGRKFGIEKMEVRYIGKINFGLFAGSGLMLKMGYVIQAILNRMYLIFGRTLPLRDTRWLSPYIIAIFRKI